MNFTQSLPSFNHSVPNCQFTYSPTDAVHFRIRDDDHRNPQELAEVMMDVIDSTAHHFATLELELDADTSSIDCSIHYLAPYTFDNALQQILATCTNGIEPSALQGHSVRFHINVLRAAEQIKVGVRADLDFQEDRDVLIPKYRREKFSSYLLKNYLSRNRNWLYASGIRNMAVQYRLGNYEQRYPDIERGLIEISHGLIDKNPCMTINGEEVEPTHPTTSPVW